MTGYPPKMIEGSGVRDNCHLTTSKVDNLIEWTLLLTAGQHLVVFGGSHGFRAGAEGGTERWRCSSQVDDCFHEACDAGGQQLSIPFYRVRG